MEKEMCSARIKEALALKNLKQADLCKMTGISKSTMSQYLSGEYEPSQIKLELIARALNVNEAWLMGFNVNKDRERPIEGDGPDEQTQYYINKIKNLSPEQQKLLDVFLTGLENQ